MSRAALYDLLCEGWLNDTHIDAFAIIINNRRKTSPKRWKPFLRVPSYAYFRRCEITFDRLIAHITTTNVEIAEYILMPTHLGNHWALPVGSLRESKWYFYDSFRNPTHIETLPSLTSSANKINWKKCQD
ncbi:hypothetical protein KSP40_PGU004566 [Platanthera guangdongensis]|uniref:Ubiquitin-like protease family profile domain-containing protein n=1 Tax=Platanthera guangdongensis TaxID=2320717 RepID=A0ABR2N5Q1_9ASPA